ncbi:hypothetical protein [Pedobacter sp. NJ-S-72]
MKIIHLNTYEGNGGAGRACSGLSDALQESGVESRVMVYYQFKESKKADSFSRTPFQKGKAIFNILSERYLAKGLTKALKTPFSLQWFGRSVISNKALKEADLIHIHWINHGFLRPKDLAELEELDKPIVWTFHDSNAFTGGCHVRYSCENFHKQCGFCPLLKMSGKK